MSHVALIGPDEHYVTVNPIPTDMSSAEVRTTPEKTHDRAEARRDYLVMSLATELWARGHDIVEALEQRRRVPS